MTMPTADGRIPDVCIHDDCTLPCVDEWGFCGSHHWVVRAEMAEGWRDLRVYLAKRAAYQDWCQAHGVPA